MVDEDLTHSVGGHTKHELQGIVVDGHALLQSIPQAKKRRQLPKRQQGVVMMSKPFVPFETRIAKLLGLHVAGPEHH